MPRRQLLGDTCCYFVHSQQQGQERSAGAPAVPSVLAPLLSRPWKRCLRFLRSWGTCLDKAAQLCSSGKLGILSQNLGLECRAAQAWGCLKLIPCSRFPCLSK